MLVQEIMENLRSEVGIVSVVGRGGYAETIRLDETCEFAGRLSLHERCHHSLPRKER